jgi:hypothetical protein
VFWYLIVGGFIGLVVLQRKTKGAPVNQKQPASDNSAKAPTGGTTALIGNQGNAASIRAIGAATLGTEQAPVLVNRTPDTIRDGMPFPIQGDITPS